MNRYRKGRLGKKDQGFGLLEASIALTTLGITLAYAMPLFLYSKMNNSKSEARTGAMMVAQRILDTQRGAFATIPQVESTTTLVDGGIDANNGSKTNLQALGKRYTANIYHCEVIAPATTSECGNNYKTLRVEVKLNDSPVYEMSAGFTNFQ